MSINSLTGSLPNTIGFMTSLQNIFFEGNQLDGTLPNTIGSLTNLVGLFLYYNKIGGTIPTTFSQLVRLSSFSLQLNYLTMGTALTVPTSTFSPLTLGFLGNARGSGALADNCLAFSYGTTAVTATHCLISESHIVF